MEKMQMQTKDFAKENVAKIAALFPNCVTEARDERGNIRHMVDFEALQQELSHDLISEKQERYQFTWPDKKKAFITANQPIRKTLRPCREESVNFDTTENLYIEGDNLEVLKLLQETYNNSIKMIYIDPPYNTGKDFIYKDNFTQDEDEYFENSGQRDEEGNRYVQNMETNGRFHTDWLNMMYPRLKLAKNLLTEDGIIFIHIDEHEVYSLNLICREIFGEQNELGTIIWDKRNPKGVAVGVAYQHESVLVYARNRAEFAKIKFTKLKEHAEEILKKAKELVVQYGVNETCRNEFSNWMKSKKNEFTGGELAYSLIDDEGNVYRGVSMAAPDKPETRSHRPLVHPITNKPCPVPAKGWRYKDKTMDELLSSGKIVFGMDESTQPQEKYFLVENIEEAVSSLIYFGGSDDAMGLPFDNPKPVYISKRIVRSVLKGESEIVLDFFSGSATTAHAVMQLNAEDGGKRKFIMVQLQEECPEDSEAFKAGYKNICEIGKERIRRAGKKIVDEAGLAAEGLDIGFRVLKVDSSNMKDVYYTPSETLTIDLDGLTENIKEDRTSEDLLFQVMLDIGIELSEKITTFEVQGKTVYDVMDGYMLACFDANLTDEVITEIAKHQPDYFVTRDGSIGRDSTLDNFEQIFKQYSPNTEKKVI